MKKAKGVSRTVVKHQIDFSDDAEIVEIGGIIFHKLSVFTSILHTIHTELKSKVALSSADDKRYVIPGDVSSFDAVQLRNLSEVNCKNNAILERCTKIKDLGVTFDSRLSFCGHINTIVSSAAKVLGYCIRNWGSFTDINTLKLIYVSFVRSKLEYASVIWSPIYQNSKTQVESVQRKFLKYMFFKHNGFYPQRGIDHNILLNLFDKLT